MQGQHKRQISFSDQAVEHKVSDDDFLIRMDKQIDWRRFEVVFKKLYASTGRPSYPPLMLFKMLLLQQWFGLSDPAVEAVVKDRLSFHRFLDVSLEDVVPDETTLVRFRQRLQSCDAAYKKLFSILNKQLDKAGVIIKHGTMIDASIIQSARKPPSKRQGKATSDEQANWAVKNGKATHGYKLHIGADCRSDVVRAIEVTPANVHDSLIFDQLIQGDERIILADKAYHSQARAERLRAQGKANGIMRRAKPNEGLDRFEREINRIASKLRAPVERIFADWKQHRKLSRARYLGLERNRNHLLMMAMAHNMRCWLRSSG